MAVAVSERHFLHALAAMYYVHPSVQRQRRVAPFVDFQAGGVVNRYLQAFGIVEHPVAYGYAFGHCNRIYGQINAFDVEFAPALGAFVFA